MELWSLLGGGPAQARLDRISRLAGAAAWEWDAASGKLSWSDPEGRGEDLERWIDSITPEDRDWAGGELRRAFTERRAFHLEFRIRALKGPPALVQAAGEAVCDRAGRAKGLAGVVWRAGAGTSERQFMANVSHELRTPVAAIRGFAESLRTGALEDPRLSRQFVRVIEKHAHRLGSMVESLLDASSYESGRRPAAPRPVPLAGLLWRLADAVSLSARHKKVGLRVKAPADLVVWADPEHLSCAVEKLCDNAIKFNRQGGLVELSAGLEEGRASLRVRDTGCGIKGGDVPFLFERYSQARRPRPTLGGSGMGLSVAKSLIESGGGRLELETTGSEGTTFLLSLPVAGAAQGPA